MTTEAKKTSVWSRGALIVLPVVVVWAVFTWPLPRYLFSGISCMAQGAEKYGYRRMIAGDHLQFLYELWLAGDMLQGKTPLFMNVYQFNTGKDEERRDVHSYFMPLPLLYLAGEVLGGRAFGWNLTVFVSLLLSYVFTALLLRRYTTSGGAAWLCAAPAVLLPHRWIVLLGGSPTGMTMMFIPLVFLGLDMAVRDERGWGGALAGLGLFLLSLGDVHALFFCALAGPCWCLVALLARENFQWTRLRAYAKIVGALLPALIGVAFVAVMVRWMQSDIGGANAGPRSPEEVKIFSSTWTGWIQWRGRGPTGHVYLGWVLPCALGTGWIWMLVRAIRDFKAGFRPWLLLSLVLAGVAGVAILALGPRGPFDGLAFRAARKLIPPYGFVRQPAKVFCLMPTLLSVACVLIAGRIIGRWPPRAAWSVCGVAVGLMAVEYRLQIDSCVTLLDEEQGAYRAVVEDSNFSQKKPRAVAVVLWPGDSHWSSLYQHYASLYRLRMVNGYRALVTKEYVENIFRRFESINMGELLGDQADELLRRNVDYVIVHEDAFPEKVSAYPVCFTIKRLLNHPRLSLVKHADRVWAFKILRDPADRPEQAAGWKAFFPARQWEMERSNRSSPATSKDESASGGAFVSLGGPDAWVETRLTSTVDAPNQRWMIRLRGKGTFTCEEEIQGQTGRRMDMEVDSAQWAWKEWPLPKLDHYSTVVLRLTGKQGNVDLDSVLLAAGEWKELPPGQSLEIPAPCFFHAGYTDPVTEHVVLRGDREPADAIFYGPNMPLGPGRYRLEFVFSSGAPRGTRLGKLTVRAGSTVRGPFQVEAGQNASAEFEVKDNLPVRMDFRYSRRGDMEVDKVIFNRVE